MSGAIPARQEEGTLVVSFGAYLSSSGEAAVPFEVVDEHFDRVRTAPTELPLNNTEVHFQVPAGRFVVRAFLPSGEMVAQQGFVHAGGTCQIVLQPESRSPRESLAWGYLLKNPFRVDLLSAPSMDVSVPLAQEVPKLEAWRNDNDAKWSRLGDRPIQLIPLAEPHSSSYGWAELNVENELVWVRVEWKQDQSKFVALPPGSPTRFNLIADDANQESPDPIHVVVDASSAQAEAALGFLLRGDFAHARTIGSDIAVSAMTLLADKTKSLSGAAIGGYVLLLTGDVGSARNWMANLDNWFPFFPDGAVIHAWSCLRQQEPDFEISRQRLLEAHRRGIPVYSFGLRLLHDGLALFAARAKERGQNDDDIEKALMGVRPYAAASDWSSGTTTFFGREANAPTLPMRHG
jgi:hypothetical protein